MATTVRLSPLLQEHSTALGADLVYFLVVLGVVQFTAGTPRGLPAVGLIASAGVFHWLQVRFLVRLRFDADGLTILRLLRRRRVAWAEVAGLIYTERGSSLANAPTTYELRLVLHGQEPPLGRHLGAVQRQDAARGPLVMALSSLDDDGEGRADHRRRQVLALLAEHGFPAPEPRPWEYRTPLFSARALTAAVAMDLRGTQAVAVRHGTDLAIEERALLDGRLTELATAHGAADTTLQEPDFTTYFFEGPEAKARAAAFLAEASGAVPAHWTLTPATLPEAAPAG